MAIDADLTCLSDSHLIFARKFARKRGNNHKLPFFAKILFGGGEEGGIGAVHKQRRQLGGRKGKNWSKLQTD